MSGIAIVNQLLLVFNLAIFGAISGVGIFGAQFYGCKNHKGVQHTFRFKVYTCLPIIPLYLCCQLLDIIKCVIGFILVKKGVWLNNIVAAAVHTSA